MNNTFSAYIAAFDELNILTSTSYYSASGKDMTSKVAQIVDDILSLLIRAYQQGITATADMLAYDLTVDVGSMEEAIYEVIDGKTFEDRIADHVIAGDLSGLQTLVESEYHRVFNAHEFLENKVSTLFIQHHFIPLMVTMLPDRVSSLRQRTM